jgi:hypothetical protein
VLQFGVQGAEIGAAQEGLEAPDRRVRRALRSMRVRELLFFFFFFVSVYCWLTGTVAFALFLDFEVYFWRGFEVLE